MLYFVDESGIDLKAAPYVVLAGVGMAEATVWPFAQAFLGLKEQVLRFPQEKVYDAKGNKLLKRKVFAHAALVDRLSEQDRADAVERLLIKNDRGEGQAATRVELAALGQAKLAFVEAALGLADDFGMTVFASIVPKTAPQANNRSFLRKDFSYLFQRIHCHVCDQPDYAQGILVLDEQDKALSQGLLLQIHEYFVETARGRQRAERMIPMPFFVHSEFTPAIQLADIIAYICNWGLRMPRMSEPAREELKPFADRVFALRYQGKEIPVSAPRRVAERKRQRSIWGLAYIEDLRPSSERPDEEAVDLDQPTATAERAQKKGVPRAGQTLPERL